MVSIFPVLSMLTLLSILCILSILRDLSELQQKRLLLLILLIDQSIPAHLILSNQAQGKFPFLWGQSQTRQGASLWGKREFLEVWWLILAGLWLIRARLWLIRTDCAGLPNHLLFPGVFYYPPNVYLYITELEEFRSIF
jgi:hypothetical protein